MKLAGCLKGLKSGPILNFGGVSWVRNMSLERNLIGLMGTVGTADIQQMHVGRVTFPLANEFLSF